jgi:hypothetical protein
MELAAHQSWKESGALHTLAEDYVVEPPLPQEEDSRSEVDGKDVAVQLSEPEVDADEERGWFVAFIVRRINVPKHVWMDLAGEGEDEGAPKRKRTRGIFGFYLIPPYHPVCLCWLGFMLLFDIIYTVGPRGREEGTPHAPHASMRSMLDPSHACMHACMHPTERHWPRACMQAFWVPLSIGFCAPVTGKSLSQGCVQADLFGGCVYALNLLLAFQWGAIFTYDESDVEVLDGMTMTRHYVRCAPP